MARLLSKPRAFDDSGDKIGCPGAISRVCPNDLDVVFIKVVCAASEIMVVAAITNDAVGHQRTEGLATPTAGACIGVLIHDDMNGYLPLIAPFQDVVGSWVPKRIEERRNLSAGLLSIQRIARDIGVRPSCLAVDCEVCPTRGVNARGTVEIEAFPPAALLRPLLCRGSKLIFYPPRYA